MNYFRLHYKKILFFACLICSLVAVAQARDEFRETTASLPESKNINTAVKIDSDVTRSIDKVVFFARDDKYRYKITAPPSMEKRFGDCINVSGAVSRPGNKGNTEAVYSFPYREYLAKDDIYLLLKVKTFETSAYCTPLSKYQEVELEFMKHKQMLTKIFLEQYEQPYAGLAAGVLIAGKGLLDKQSLDMFKKTSLSHVVVLSGSNVSIILVCIKVFIGWLFFWKRTENSWIEWLKKIIILLAVWAFVLLTGGGAPIYRAAASAFCGLILFDKQTSQIYALSIVILILTIINPFQTLYDPSFHLTCCATFGLILFSKPIDDKMKFSVLRFIPNWLREIIAVTLATQVFVFPYIVFMTSSFSSVFLLSNVLVLPVIPFIMLFGFLTMLGSLIGISFLVSMCVWINNFLLHFVFWIVKILSEVPYSFVELQKSTSIMVLILYFVLLLFFICIASLRSPS